MKHCSYIVEVDHDHQYHQQLYDLLYTDVLLFFGIRQDPFSELNINYL